MCIESILSVTAVCDARLKAGPLGPRCLLVAMATDRAAVHPQPVLPNQTGGVTEKTSCTSWHFQTLIGLFFFFVRHLLYSRKANFIHLRTFHDKKTAMSRMRFVCLPKRTADCAVKHNYSLHSNFKFLLNIIEPHHPWLNQRSPNGGNTILEWLVLPFSEDDLMLLLAFLTSISWHTSPRASAGRVCTNGSACQEEAQ